MPSPLDCMMVNIARWEGLYQAMSGDPGNWIDGRLVGTMRGVTPAVLAAHRGIDHASITADIMRSVTLVEAAEIGVKRFYLGTGLDKLAWGPATDALVDFGWGSGPGQAVKSCERMLHIVNPDYRVGEDTIKSWADDVADMGWEYMVRRVNAMRQDFYDLICRQNATLQQFREGWRNRADWMLPGGDWWSHWHGDVDSTVAVAAADAAPSHPMPQRLFSVGSFSEEVAAIQTALNNAFLAAEGMDAMLDVDGNYGSTTMRAVRRLQELRGIDVDGIVGDQTWAALGLS